MTLSSSLPNCRSYADCDVILSQLINRYDKCGWSTDAFFQDVLNAYKPGCKGLDWPMHVWAQKVSQLSQRVEWDSMKWKLVETIVKVFSI